MAAKYWIMKNGVLTAKSPTLVKTILAQGNPAGEGEGVGKYSTKVRSTGPVSGGKSTT